MNKRQEIFLLSFISLFISSVILISVFQPNQLYASLQIEIKPTETFIDSTVASESPVNINTATKEELMSLEKIGSIKAEAIIAHREYNGKFRKAEEITDVDGIGTKIYELNRHLITVE